MALNMTVPLDAVSPEYLKKHFGDGVSTDELTVRVKNILNRNPNITPRDIAAFFRQGCFPLIQKAHILAIVEKRDFSRRRLLRLGKGDLGYGEVQFRLGLIAYESGTMDTAVMHFKNVPKDNSDYGETQFWLGLIAYKDNDISTAKMHWENVGDDSEKYGIAQYNLAIIAIRSGNTYQAKVHWERVSSESEAYGKAQTALEKLAST